MTPNERVAHDILCVAKYGSPGGTVYAEELTRMRRYLESCGLVQRPVPAVRLAPPKVRVTPPSPTPAIQIKLP